MNSKLKNSIVGSENPSLVNSNYEIQYIMIIKLVEAYYMSIIVCCHDLCKHKFTYIIQLLHAGTLPLISISTSEPRNAKKIAVKKVSDVDVSMFRLEL